jgi:hypothetical protein
MSSVPSFRARCSSSFEEFCSITRIHEVQLRGLPGTPVSRPNLRLPEGFRSFTPLTTGERRSFRSVGIAAFRSGFASSSRISLACGIGFHFARHGRLLFRATALLVTDTDVLAAGTMELGFSAAHIEPCVFTSLPLSMLSVGSSRCRHHFDRPSTGWNSRV